LTEGKNVIKTESACGFCGMPIFLWHIALPDWVILHTFEKNLTDDKINRI